jgi:hypothetical protein
VSEKRKPKCETRALGAERDKALASDAGFDHHLVKPVALKDLQRLLANVAAMHT